MNAAQHFKEKKYIYLSNTISREECSKLTDYMFGLFDEGKLINYDKSPISESVYGDPVFDSIIEKLTQSIS